MNTPHAAAIATLRGWRPPDLGQGALREAFLGFLLSRPDALSRSCLPGHLTASAIVLSADRTRTLLTLHPRVGRWLQLGGHCEPSDRTLAAAALREATEESGIAGLKIDPLPIRLDVHPITCSLGVPTRHFDVQFRATAPSDARPAISAESDELAFFGVDALPDTTDESVRELLRTALTG